MLVSGRLRITDRMVRLGAGRCLGSHRLLLSIGRGLPRESILRALAAFGLGVILSGCQALQASSDDDRAMMVIVSHRCESGGEVTVQANGTTNQGTHSKEVRVESRP